MSRIDFVMDNIELKRPKEVYFGIDWGYKVNANGDVLDQEALRRVDRQWLKEHGVSELTEIGL